MANRNRDAGGNKKVFVPPPASSGIQPLKNHLTPSLASLFAASALALGLGSCIITIDDGGAHWGSYSAFHSSGHGPRHTGSGVTGEDARDLPGIHSVELEGSLDVDVTVAPGAPQRVTVVGDDNLLAHVRTEVRDGVLYVDLDSGSYRMKQELRVVATVSELRELDLEGSGDMSAFGVDAEVLAVHLDGSGDIELSGRARVLERHDSDREAEKLAALFRVACGG